MALQIKTPGIIKTAQSADATGGLTIWNPTTGKKFNITDLIVSTDTAMYLTFYDGVTVLIVVYLAANGGFVSNFQTPLNSQTADNNFAVTASVAGNISITALGFES